MALMLALPARVQAQDQTSLGELAELLALEDRRELDAGVMARAAQHPDTLVRIRAAMAMGRIGDTLATPTLLRLVQDPEERVRIEAVFALGELGHRAAVGELTRQLDLLPANSTGEWPREVATALCKIGGPQADLAIARLLQRHQPESGGGDRATSAALLEAWRLGARSQTAALLAEYVRRAGGDWKRNAVYSAGRLALPAAAQGLLEAAGDSSSWTRMWALRGLTAAFADSARLGRDAFVTRIRPLLSDPDAQVRTNALRALGTFADSNLARDAAPRLIDRDPNVTIQAAATLGALRGSRALAALRERLVNPGTFGQRRALLVALAQIAPDTALAVAAPLATDGDWRLRFLWTEVVATARPANGKATALAMLGDADARVVAAALGVAAQLSESGDSAVKAAALERLTHADIGVRSTAADIIGREISADMIDPLVAAYRRADGDPQNDARLSAARALASLAGNALLRPRVIAAFVAAVPRPTDYLIRRMVAARFGEAVHRQYWGAVLPVETGRGPEEYREAVRRYIYRTGAGGRMRVNIETDRGTIVVDLLPYDAPLTVDNFVRLVDRRFFDNGRWHRVVPNFVIQDGDSRGDGSGGSPSAIRDEINRWRYERGAVGMALSGPDTGTSQFFITHSAQPHLDGGYTIFGRVAVGLDVLDQIVQGDRLRRMTR